jgi:hypothetical protein
MDWLPSEPSPKNCKIHRRYSGKLVVRDTWCDKVAYAKPKLALPQGAYPSPATASETANIRKAFLGGFAAYAFAALLHEVRQQSLKRRNT